MTPSLPPGPGFPEEPAAAPEEIESERFTDGIVGQAGLRTTVFDFFYVIVVGFWSILQGLVGGGEPLDRGPKDQTDQP